MPKCNVLESFGIALANRTVSNSFCDCGKCYDCAARRDVWLKRGFRLSIDFLKSCGLLEFKFDRKPAVRIPYFAEIGEELAVRFRIALEGDRFRWKSGKKPCLYGLNRMAELKKTGQVALVEGTGNWREDRDNESGCSSSHHSGAAGAARRHDSSGFVLAI